MHDSEDLGIACYGTIYVLPPRGHTMIVSAQKVYLTGITLIKCTYFFFLASMQIPCSHSHFQ